MSQSPKVSPEVFAESMRDEVEQCLKEMMNAVNDAPDGNWIAGSEEQVRDIAETIRRRCFQQAIQKRVDAAEAAFPPSARSDDGKATGE
jgi:hypothetical protein